MTDKEFDQLIQGKLKDFQPEFESSWDDFEPRVQEEVEPSVDPLDNLVRAAVGQYAVPNSKSDWSEMERLIQADEAALFDDEVRESVENFEAPYDNQSWPILDKKITADEWNLIVE